MTSYIISYTLLALSLALTVRAFGSITVVPLLVPTITARAQLAAVQTTSPLPLTDYSYSFSDIVRILVYQSARELTQ